MRRGCLLGWPVLLLAAGATVFVAGCVSRASSLPIGRFANCHFILTVGATSGEEVPSAVAFVDSAAGNTIIVSGQPSHYSLSYDDQSGHYDVTFDSGPESQGGRQRGLWNSGTGELFLTLPGAPSTYQGRRVSSADGVCHETVTK